MGFLAWFRRRPAGIGEIRFRLFEAVRRRDDAELMRLVNRYDVVIRHEFATWRTMPPALLGHARWDRWYGEGLIGVAEFYRRCGVSVLIDALMGPEAANPLVAWEEATRRAAAALAAAQPLVAIGILTPLVADLDGSAGTGVDHYRPLIFAALGSAYRAVGDRERALAFTQRALDDSRRCGDTIACLQHEAVLRELRSA